MHAAQITAMANKYKEKLFTKNNVINEVAKI